MSAIQGFEYWVGKATAEMEHVAVLLRTSLSDEPEELICDLMKIESRYGRTGYLLAEANSWLDRAQRIWLPTKDRGTGFDRKIILDDDITTYRLMRDKIEAIHDAIKTRISLGQSLIAYRRQSIENSKHS